MLLEPDGALRSLLTGVLDGWLVLHATLLLGSPGTELGRTSVLAPPRRAPEPSGD